MGGPRGSAGRCGSGGAAIERSVTAWRSQGRCRSLVPFLQGRFNPTVGDAASPGCLETYGRPGGGVRRPAPSAVHPFRRRRLTT